MAEPERDAVPLVMKLRYAHPQGFFGPYFEGLEAGRAVAARCPECGRTWFPPRAHCPEHRRETEWCALSGRGRIVSVTVGETALPFGRERARRAFALVAMDGAANLAFGRIAGEPEAPRPGMRVRLERAPGRWPHPAQAAWYVADG
jgi:hypothetical protein